MDLLYCPCVCVLAGSLVFALCAWSVCAYTRYYYVCVYSVWFCVFVNVRVCVLTRSSLQGNLSSLVWFDHCRWGVMNETLSAAHFLWAQQRLTEIFQIISPCPLRFSATKPFRSKIEKLWWGWEMKKKEMGFDELGWIIIQNSACNWAKSKL